MIKILLVFAALLLGGCQNKAFITSIPGGESKVFEAPKYEVLGKTQHDQNWIDRQVEGGVAAYGWKRPAPRPPEWDAPKQSGARKPAVKQSKQKPSILKRIKSKVTGKPVTASPTPPSVPYVDDSPPPKAEPPAPPPKPRRPIDELLYPRR